MYLLVHHLDEALAAGQQAGTASGQALLQSALMWQVLARRAATLRLTHMRTLRVTCNLKVHRCEGGTSNLTSSGRHYDE
jgi:hypothetical protein